MYTVAFKTKTKNLRTKPENKVKATTTARVNGGIAMTSSVKRPMNGEILLRYLIHQTSCPPSQSYCGITAKNILPYDRKSQGCSRIGTSMSDSNHPVTSDFVMDASVLRAVNGNKDHSHETTMAPLCANRQDHSKAADVSLDVNLHVGEGVPRFQITVLFQNSAENQVQLPEGTVRSSFLADKKKKNGKTENVVCSNHVGLDHRKKVRAQKINHLSFDDNSWNG